MNTYFLLAALLSIGVLAAHIFGGGRFYVRPLLAADLHPVPKYVHYYCWHIVTMTLAAMAVSFGRAAVHPGARDLAVLMTVLAAGFAVWSLGLVLWKRQRPLHMPQWALFAAGRGLRPSGAGGLSARLGRDDWLALGLERLAAEGPRALRLENICAAAGRTRGSFYHHFRDHDELPRRAGGALAPRAHRGADRSHA